MERDAELRGSDWDQPTPYTYIQRNYGKTFLPGQRVRFTEYEGARGNGVVLDEGSHSHHHVRVRFDDGHDGHCHPNSLEIVSDPT